MNYCNITLWKMYAICFKGEVHPKMEIQFLYPPPILMEVRWSFLAQQKSFWSFTAKQFWCIFLNNWGSWGLVYDKESNQITKKTLQKIKWLHLLQFRIQRSQNDPSWPRVGAWARSQVKGVSNVFSEGLNVVFTPWIITLKETYYKITDIKE